MKNMLNLLVIFNLLLLTLQNLRKDPVDVSFDNYNLNTEFINLSKDYSKSITINHGKNHNTEDNLLNLNHFKTNFQETDLLHGEVEKFVPIYVNENYKYLNDNSEEFLNNLGHSSDININNDGFKKFSFYENNHLYEGGNVLKGVKLLHKDSFNKNNLDTNFVDLSMTGSKKVIGFLN